MLTSTKPQNNFENSTRFTYALASVRDIRVGEVHRSPGGRISLKELEIDGQPVAATRRFWRSFFTRFGIAENVFRYFRPDEVFARIQSQREDVSFRYCIARSNLADSKRADQLLAITNPNRPIIRYDDIRGLLDQNGGQDVRYHNGVVTSTHAPRGGSRQFAIGGDQFRDRFCLETPVDGYGHPRLFLSMLRLVCSNGMIGHAKAFRSDVPVGKNMEHCIVRALESFDNGDGYAALRQRFESSQTSWASVHECLRLNELLESLRRDEQLTQTGLVGRFRSIAGDLNELYGLANLDALSDKRRRILPSKARVYDLINFASEVATHHAKADGANRIQAWLGSLISEEFDLEGTANSGADFDAFFVPSNDGLPAQSRN
ncbi:DUF932 domain-containing protein [Rhodopirellula halodulae]|uniref:DUF932 domain-containing protein n=1 Tax=Rhodopirellula halodulae TaxID=2894198 RepID=UPI001E458041|nr:DUF932 domain-containing protein [Rhodopirellula sp. JC737]MCC9657184.1 DUF932 domain-containing protein [Rhodopirellula sp. JC737]